MANEIIRSTTQPLMPPVGVASIQNIEKKDYNNGTSVEYRLQFIHANGMKTVWIFPTSGARDTAYTTILTQYGFNAY